MSNYQRAFLLALGFTVLAMMVYHARTHDGFVVDEPRCDVYHHNGKVGRKCEKGVEKACKESEKNDVSNMERFCSYF